MITKEELTAVQLNEFPDSIELSVRDMFEIVRYEADVFKWRWLAIALSYLETGPILFYKCGFDGNKYKWIGCRFGTEPCEYLSGF